jgi:hypothetical protein
MLWVNKMDGKPLLYLGLFWLGNANALLNRDISLFWLNIIFAIFSISGFFIIEYILANKERLLK